MKKKQHMDITKYCHDRSNPYAPFNCGMVTIKPVFLPDVHSCEDKGSYCNKQLLETHLISFRNTLSWKGAL